MLSNSVMDSAAVEIAQHALQETAQALLAADFDRFKSHFALPHTITTPTGAKVMETEEDMVETFNSVAAHYRSSRVVELRRSVNSAFFIDPGKILFTHQTELVDDDNTVEAPFHSLSEFHQFDEGWKAVDTWYATGYRDALSSALLRGKTSSPRGNPVALSLLQNYMDSITTAFLADDRATVCDLISYPFFIQGNEGNRLYTCDAEAIADFDYRRMDFYANGITDVIRTAISAEFIGQDRMQGTYRTYVLRGTTLAQDPFVSSLTLERGQDDVWRGTSVQHPIGYMSKGYRPYGKSPKDGAQ